MVFVGVAVDRRSSNHCVFARVAAVEESTSRSQVTTGRRVAVGQASRTRKSDEAGNGACGRGN